MSRKKRNILPSPDVSTGLTDQSEVSRPRRIPLVGMPLRSWHIGRSLCLPFALIVVALCLLLVIGSVLGVAKTVNDFLHPQPIIEVPTSTTVIEKIQTMGKLETVSYTLEKIIRYDQDANSFWHFLGDHTKLFVVQGVVTAGVDLSEISKNDITIQGGPDIKTASITLTLPASQILNASIDENNSRVYDANSGVYGLLGSQVDSNTVVKILAAAKQSLRSDACQGNILQNASDSAKTQLTSLLTAIGFQHVEVNTSNGKCS